MPTLASSLSSSSSASRPSRRALSLALAAVALERADPASAARIKQAADAEGERAKAQG